MTTHNHKWPFMTIHDHTWPYMTITDHIWPYIFILEHTWPYMTTHDHTWPHMTTHDLTWPYMTINDYTQPYRMIQDDTGPHISTESHKELSVTPFLPFSVSPFLHISVKFQLIELLTQLKRNDVIQHQQMPLSRYLQLCTKFRFSLTSIDHSSLAPITPNIILDTVAITTTPWL